MSSSYAKEKIKLGDRHYQAGRALTRVDDLTGAAEEFRKALLFQPDNPVYELSLATALVNSGRLDEAESHLEQLSQSDPTNGQINLLLAEVAQQQHHVNEAMESYQRAVYEYWPRDQLNERRQARWALIDLLSQTGKHRDQLVGELLQLYGNLPPHSDQRMRVGLALMRAGADAEAANVFRDVLKDSSSEAPAEATADQIKAHSGLAKIAFRSGDFVQARHDYQRALKLGPDDLSTASALELTNNIIDMAPELPNISPSERLRRSENLLKRVEADLSHCSGEDQITPTAPALAPAKTVRSDTTQTPACAAGTPAGACALEQRLKAVNATVAHTQTDKQDEAGLLQQAAQALWKDRASFCGQAHLSDPALEAVLPRLEQ